MGLLTLPIAQVRGLIGVAEAPRQCRAELHDSGELRAQLDLLKRELEDGCIDTEGVRTGKRKGYSTG